MELLKHISREKVEEIYSGDPYYDTGIIEVIRHYFGDTELKKLCDEVDNMGVLETGLHIMEFSLRERSKLLIALFGDRCPCCMQPRLLFCVCDDSLTHAQKNNVEWMSKYKKHITEHVKRFLLVKKTVARKAMILRIESIADYLCPKNKEPECVIKEHKSDIEKS